MVNFYSAFLSQDYRNAEQALQPTIQQAIEKSGRKKAKAEGKPMTEEVEAQIRKSYVSTIPRPPLSVLIDQIDHIAKIAASTMLDWARTSMAFPRPPRDSIPPPTCPRSRKRSWLAATARKTWTGFSVVIFFASSRRSKRFRSNFSQRRGHLSRRTTWTR